MQDGTPQELIFTVPIFEPLPTQYWVRAISDRWLGAEVACPVNFRHLMLPERHPPHTDLLDLQPLPVTALKNTAFQQLYPFTHFNPIQTQVFHVAYHTDTNMLVGAPTGSGKTATAELALMRMLTAHKGTKAVYVAPLKALARERLADWRRKFGQLLGVSVLELTGDHTPDMRALQRADVLITTPEKWDGVSRSWHRRGYVQKVGLVILDEVHLLGEDRGPILEVIVSRMRYIASQTKRTMRFVGLSTALANARDLADWLGIDRVGLYNFRPSVRPVPLEVHISGFPGKHYCPRMATMNKPTYVKLCVFVLVFVCGCVCEILLMLAVALRLPHHVCPYCCALCYHVQVRCHLHTFTHEACAGVCVVTPPDAAHCVGNDLLLCLGGRPTPIPAHARGRHLRHRADHPRRRAKAHAGVRDWHPPRWAWSSGPEAGGGAVLQRQDPGAGVHIHAGVGCELPCAPRRSEGHGILRRQAWAIRGLPHHGRAADDGAGRATTVRRLWQGMHPGARAEEAVLPQVPLRAVPCGVTPQGLLA